LRPRERRARAGGRTAGRRERTEDVRERTKPAEQRSAGFFRFVRATSRVPHSAIAGGGSGAALRAEPVHSAPAWGELRRGLEALEEE
jgi:hypothetical protein